MVRTENPSGTFSILVFLLFATLGPACSVERSIRADPSPRADGSQMRGKPRAQVPSASTTPAIADTETSPRERLGWPQQFAGRERVVVGPEYVVYATDTDSHAGLDRWLQFELKRFRSKFELEPSNPGLIFTVESGDEPDDRVEIWRRANIRRERLIYWTSPIRRQMILTPSGRPYSASRTPYFRESFAMPVQQAFGLGLLHSRMPQPAWICFLTTDQYYFSAFDKRRSDARRRGWTKLREAPSKRLIANLPFILMMYAASGLIVPRYRQIDLQLMRLQRREVLYDSLIRSATIDDGKRRQLETSLQNRIDKRWKHIYVRRPIE